MITLLIAATLIVNLDAVQYIESGNNPNAYNKITHARGLFQITPICLKDYNKFHGEKIKLNDLYNPVKNKKVAAWYLFVRIPELLNAYDILISETTVLWAYNAGAGNIKKNIMPGETKNYIKKYQKYLKERIKNE